MEKLSVSLAEAETLTSVSRFTLRRQIKRGVLKVTRVGRRIVIPLAELKKLVCSGDRGRERKSN
jgi:excisionase family DNA binding protein